MISKLLLIQILYSVILHLGSISTEKMAGDGIARARGMCIYNLKDAAKLTFKDGESFPLSPGLCPAESQPCVYALADLDLTAA